jgi:hypothetical protein
MMISFSRQLCLIASIALVALVTAALSMLGGCETIGQDFNDIASAIKPTTPTEAAKMMMDPYNADNRREGTTLISNAPWGGVDIYVKAYRDKVLNEPDPIAKAAAIRALARWGEPADALRIGGKNLVDPNFQVRWEAAKGLQRLHNPAVIPDLLIVLRDDETTDVRVAAAIALGQYPEDRVFQGLVGALDARELAVNEAAENSLHLLTGQSFDMDSHRWLTWYNGQTAAGHAFANQGQYLYPTYYRDDLWWEKLEFWTTRNWEKPAPPAGLRPKSERSTYQDETPPSS